MLRRLVLFCGLWILRMCIRPVQLITLAPIFWNASNPIFKASKNDHVIDVKPFDDIDFICPYYHFDNYYDNDKTFIRTINQPEYYHIYLVSRREYDNCNIYYDSGTVLLLSCSSPLQRKRFTVLFDSIQSIPNVPEFRPATKYYFITTSTGRREGVHNLYQGACVEHNMKLTVRISQEAKTIDSSRRPANKSIGVVRRMQSSDPQLSIRRHEDGDDAEGYPMSLAADRRREGVVTTIGTAAVTPLQRTSLSNRATRPAKAIKAVFLLSFIAFQTLRVHLHVVLLLGY